MRRTALPSRPTPTATNHSDIAVRSRVCKPACHPIKWIRLRPFTLAGLDGGAEEAGNRLPDFENVMDKVKSAVSLPVDAHNADLSGRVLGDYQIIRRIGRGGM